MKKEVSLETVARRAGVAKSTVSFVLNDKANVASQTREKVLTALKELGYMKEGPAVPPSQPVTPAKGNSVKKNILIYVNPSVRENEVVSSYMAGLREYAASEGHLVFSYAMSSSEIESDLQLAFLEQAAQPQGILMVGINSDHPFVRQALQTGKPCLIVNRISDYPDLSYVSINHHQAGRDAARYLAGLGHRNFLLIVHNSYNETEIMRVEGFLEELAASQPEAEVALVRRYRATGPAEEYRAASPKDLLRDEKLTFNQDTRLNLPAGLVIIRQKDQLPAEFSPTCVVAANDQVAFPTQTALQSFGLEIPRDLSIMSLNSSSLSVKANPPITAIDESWQEMGKLAGQILDNLIGSSLLRSQKILIQHRLVERGSTAHP
jgi:LacI family transcriptional regulator